MSYTYPGRRRDPSPTQKLFTKIGVIIAIFVLVMMLVQSGAIYTIRRWVTGEVTSGATAVEQSRQNFDSSISRSRQHQEDKSMGTGSNRY